MTDNSAYNRIYETANEGGIYATPASYNVPIPSNATVGGAPLSPQFVDALANYLNSQSQQQPPTQDPATAVAPTAGAVTAPPSAPQADSMASPSETAQPQPPQSQEDSAVDPMLANILSGNAPQQPKVNAPAVEGADQSLVNAISGIPNPQQPSEPPDRNDFRYRMAFGMQDPLAGIGQAAAHIIPSAIEPAGYAKSIDQQINQREAEYQKAHNVEGIDFARIAGNIISPANALLPLRAIAAIPEGGSALMRIAKSALAGGAMAAAQPTDVSGEVSYGGAKGLQTVAGAATGAALSAAGEGLARMINPKVSADAQTLLDEGIRVPTDQIGGGGGSKLTSVPVVGDMISARHNEAVQDLNTTVLNKALGAIGEKIPEETPQFGNDALAYTRQRLGNAYDDLLPTLHGNINDATENTLGQRLITDETGAFADAEKPVGGGKPLSFQQKFSQMMNDKYSSMHLDTANEFGKIVNNVISKNTLPDGSFDGLQFKEMETTLNNEINDYRISTDPQDRKIANGLMDVKGMLKDQLAATTPEGAQQLSNLNKGYSIFKTAQKAAASTAAPNGVFNPSQLYAAVKAGDKTLNKRAFTEGDLPLYDLASAAKNVLSEYKSSGTAERGLASLLAAGVLTGHMPNLIEHPIGSALGATYGLMYTQPGQAAGRALMTARPEFASPLAELVRRATDVSGITPYTAGAVNRGE